MTAPNLVEAALTMIEMLDWARRANRKRQKAHRALFPDDTLLAATPNAVESAAVELADAILGEGLASYYLYERTRATTTPETLRGP